MQPEEIRQIDTTKSYLNNVYSKLVLNPDQSITPFLDTLLVEVIDNDTVPTNLLRVAIKTLIKLFTQVDKATHLTKLGEGQQELWNPSSLLSSLINCQFDDHSTHIDQQEQIWLNIQQLVHKIFKTLPTTKETQLQIVEFYFKLLRQRGFSCNSELGQTVHFTEDLKKNTLKLFSFLFNSEELSALDPAEAFDIIYNFVLDSISVLNKPIELDEQGKPKMTQKEKNKENEKFIRAVSFGVKLTEEILHEFVSQKTDEQLAAFITGNINKIVEMTSLACEQQLIIIKNQAQMLASFFITHILRLKLPLRE